MGSKRARVDRHRRPITVGRCVDGTSTTEQIQHVTDEVCWPDSSVLGVSDQSVETLCAVEMLVDDACLMAPGNPVFATESTSY